MQRQAVNSSMIASVGYDTETATLEIQFKKSGDVRTYPDIPPAIYDGLMSAESIGKYFNAHIAKR